MKKFLIALSAAVLIHVTVAAEIKNGYASKINDAFLALNNLSKILTEDINRDTNSGVKLFLFKKQKLKLEIRKLEQFIHYYELTEKLLGQFNIIAPDLYNEIDSIKDANGENIDVYVKFVPNEWMIVSQKGITEMDKSEYDENVCTSVYGNRSISVMICLEIHSLFILAHEFGHVKYLGPHFATYMKYYKKTYQGQSFDSNYIGHHSKDPSGKMAISFARRYRLYYKMYRKNAKDLRKIPIALNNNIER